MNDYNNGREAEFGWNSDVSNRDSYEDTRNGHQYLSDPPTLSLRLFAQGLVGVILSMTLGIHLTD